ncbi:hypothetical protein DLJ49_12045 [Rhodovulum sp. 12E13]|uniref:Hint domain-containing protein n=1 Tax=Rhodovulum sp. 12E13 TaxID=2203891 RepID=UPI000E187B97|nr:Hint domain-containing protein [Rhodovulum sp. 12E13]RDC72089.1 hypothetical protein DLJ49_12045 [Rhodovulum sp. 12E13]
MTIIRPPDSEFEIATGSNVNTSGGPGTFDAASPDVRGLEITIPSDDEDPYLFEVGETYDLSFQSAAGPVDLRGATILRSDVSNGYGQDPVVVFEGSDQWGETVQVVWAPGFDLSGWVESMQANGARAGFHTADQSAETYRMPCFAAGTRIATPLGLRRVETLRAGDRVLARDGGVRRIVWSGQALCPGRGASAPVVIAPGFLGNARPLVLSRQHRVLVADPRGALWFDAGEVFVPAVALAEAGAARVVPRSRIVWCHLLLDTHDIVTAEGAACESLYPGDVALGHLPAVSRSAVEPLLHGPDAAIRPGPLARPALSLREARLLLHRAGRAAA